jgi:Aldehyde dehydrogenase family/Aminotransferase class-III
VFSVVTGPAQPVVDALLASPTVRALSFTGSTEIGRKLLEGGAATVKKMSMKLGGHAPMIVFPEVDLEDAVAGAVAAKFQTGGQDCLAANRIYVHSSIHERFALRFAAYVKDLRVGNGLEEGVDIGPLMQERALDKCAAHVADARAKGGRVLAGGQRLGDCFFAPTVIADASDDMMIASEERNLTGLPLFRKAFDLPLARAHHTLCPRCWKYARLDESELDFARRCAADLEQLILAEGPETVAAFIGEPAMGTGGLIPAPEGYWAEIQKVLSRYDVLLIADEVVTGFGRLGTWFGSDYYGMQPDLITLAKGLTSAYLPLSGVVGGEKVWQVLEQGSEQFGAIGHGWTYSAHPTCVAAALANPDIIEREDLLGNVREVGPYLLGALRAAVANHPMVGEVRGVGMLAAVELVEDKAAKCFFEPAGKVGAAVTAACLERGMIARAMPHGDILGFALRPIASLRSPSPPSRPSPPACAKQPSWEAQARADPMRGGS